MAQSLLSARQHREGACIISSSCSQAGVHRYHLATKHIKYFLDDLLINGAETISYFCSGDISMHGSCKHVVSAVRPGETTKVCRVLGCRALHTVAKIEQEDTKADSR